VLFLFLDLKARNRSQFQLGALHGGSMGGPRVRHEATREAFHRLRAQAGDQ